MLALANSVCLLALSGLGLRARKNLLSVVNVLSVMFEVFEVSAIWEKLRTYRVVVRIFRNTWRFPERRTGLHFV